MFQHSDSTEYESPLLIKNSRFPSPHRLSRGSSPSSSTERDSRPPTPDSFAYSSSNTSLESLSLPSTPVEQDASLPDVQLTLPSVQLKPTAHFDRALRGIDTNLDTPIAKRPGTNLSTPTAPGFFQSPRPVHAYAHNALGLVLDKASYRTTDANGDLIPDDEANSEPAPGQEVPPITQPPPPTPTFSAPQQFTAFLQSLNGHQLRVEPEADSDRLLISLGPFVVSVLPIAPQ